MSTKHFCDCCKKEMRAEDLRRLMRGKFGAQVQVITAVNNVWNGGHVCHDCVIKIVTEGVDLSDRVYGPRGDMSQTAIQ